MYLHDSILWAIGPDGASGLDIYCEAEKREEIAKFFEETFEKYWSEAEDAVEEEYGDCNEKEEECGSPACVKVSETGVRVLFGPIYLSYHYGDDIESDGFADKALVKALKKLLKEYPDVTYEGYIGFRWSDTSCGDVTQYELSSKERIYGETDKVYDFVGSAIALGLQDDEFWDELSDQLEDADDFKQVMKCFHAYAKWIPDDTMEKLLDLAEEIDEDIRPELEEIIEAWENGEDVEIGDGIDTSNLPEGYMEALMGAIKEDEAQRDAEIEDEFEEEEDGDDE